MGFFTKFLFIKLITVVVGFFAKNKAPVNFFGNKIEAIGYLYKKVIKLLHSFLKTTIQDNHADNHNYGNDAEENFYDFFITFTEHMCNHCIIRL